MSVSDLIRDRALKKDSNWGWYANLPDGVEPSTRGAITYERDGVYSFHPAIIKLTKAQVDTTHRVAVPPNEMYLGEEERTEMNRHIKPAATGKINEWLHSPGGLVPRVLAKRHTTGLGGRSRRKGLRRTRRNK
jgi:hypothetical protein